MKRSHVIALAGISAALAYVSILLSFYVDIMSLSFGALAGICLMLPLTVRSITGALFAYASSSILAGLTIGFGAMTFIIFFGPFTLLCYVIDFRMYPRMNMPRWAKMLIGYVIKGVFYSAMVTGLYFLMSAFGNVDVIVESNLIWAFVVLLILAFFLFDILLHLVFINLNNLINRRILRTQGSDNNVKRKSAKSEPKVDIDVFGLDARDDESKGEGEPKDDAVETKNDTPNSDTVDESSSRFAHFLEVEESEDKDKNTDDTKDEK